MMSSPYPYANTATKNWRPGDPIPVNALVRLLIDDMIGVCVERMGDSVHVVYKGPHGERVCTYAIVALEFWLGGQWVKGKDAL